MHPATACARMCCAELDGERQESTGECMQHCTEKSSISSAPDKGCSYTLMPWFLAEHGAAGNSACAAGAWDVSDLMGAFVCE